MYLIWISAIIGYATDPGRLWMLKGIDMYVLMIHIRIMKTTLNLNDDLVEKARTATGIKEKTALIHRGLELLIRKASQERLAHLGGTKTLKKIPRRRNQN